MKRMTVEEFEAFVSEAKTRIFEAAEEEDSEVTVTVEDVSHAYDSHAITVTCDDIYVPIGCDLGASSDVCVANADDEGTMLASVLAVFSDALDIELDEDRFVLPESTDSEALFEQAEWFLTNGVS